MNNCASIWLFTRIILFSIVTVGLGSRRSDVRRGLYMPLQGTSTAARRHNLAIGQASTLVHLAPALSRTFISQRVIGT